MSEYVWATEFSPNSLANKTEMIASAILETDYSRRRLTLHCNGTKRGKVNHSTRYFSSLQEFGLLIHATQLTLSQLNSTNPIQLYSKVSFLISICCSRKMWSSVDLICHSAVSYAHMFHTVYLNLTNGTGACIQATRSDAYGTAVGRQCWSSVYRELFTQVS